MFSFTKRISNDSINDQRALQASQAARSRIEEPEIRLAPEVAKQRHKWSTKPDVLAWSKIFLNISLGAQTTSGPEPELDALRPWATLDNKTATQAVDSHTTSPDKSPLEHITYKFNKIRELKTTWLIFKH